MSEWLRQTQDRVMHLPACAPAACGRALTPVKKVDSADENTLKKTLVRSQNNRSPIVRTGHPAFIRFEDVIVVQFIHFNRNKNGYLE